MPLYVWLIILHPLWVTLLALVALACLLSWTGLWARYRYQILVVLLALYMTDTGFALPRVMFSHSLSNGPVVAQKTPLPRQLVLVNVLCGVKCHNMLISGAVEDVVVVRSRRSGAAEGTSAVRYRPDWIIPGMCPRERQQAIGGSREALLWTGYCPLVEPADLPTYGTFLIKESMIVTASKRAQAYTPTHLLNTPPGPMIRFAGVEVQNRSSSGTIILASAYRYEAPGFLGLPPLIGCWDRPDNVIWIMPPGDTGCGLWRWFTWGGNEAAATDPKWLFDDVFAPPDRPVIPPKRTELKPATPAEALKILSSVDPIEHYLPNLREALLDPANKNQALTELVAKRARGRTLEGSLIALLAAKRPAALVGLARLLNPAPVIFAKSGEVLDEMEKNPEFRDEFADTMVLTLAAVWQTPENIDRFLRLMENSHTNWICDHLDHLPKQTRVSRNPGNMAIKNYTKQCPISSQ